MNARFSRIVSRLTLVSAVAVSGAALAACSRAPTTETQAKTQVAEEGVVAARGPANGVFRELSELDLRDAQREALADVELNLAADLAPHRETIRQVAETLAAAVEDGKLDPEEAGFQRAALTAALEDANASFALAMNEVHDALDADQRAEIVARLRAKHEARRAKAAEAQGDAEHKGSLAKLVAAISLTPEQQRAIHDAVRTSVDKAFPERQARREEWEKKTKALAEAFVRDDFDAEDHDMSGHAADAIASFTNVAETAIDVSGKVLGDSQREALATMIRERAAKL
jgi:hypothetical protein